eukprot:883823-Pleurochrysis_carterae.AAC.1
MPDLTPMQRNNVAKEKMQSAPGFFSLSQKREPVRVKLSKCQVIDTAIDSRQYRACYLEIFKLNTGGHTCSCISDR